ncbi:MAG: hypothetical protein A2Y62_16550 [Candidatus Fischerbacteria bacterium RBG_13_37_8]|uniref:Glycosyl transferase family 1 domain-containing protein n=1 Tax=Candidatus Fischerbacteria bacterium RBG_13_37_8 TaxID=1817863 RepID=A0A1F5VNQ9_9BACT|nr:MAG: hypothetical protein A2Y62_16550 [Candidatus Fischerbacteria bacterium RBG_13_37_8]
MHSKKKIKCIAITAEPPPYKLFWNDSRPKISWDISENQWIGLWEYEWANVLAQEMLKLTDDFTFEYWQPDLIANTTYVHSLANNISHKLFPAAHKKKLYGLKTIQELFSPSMIAHLQAEAADNDFILHLHGNPLLFKNIINSFKNKPIISTYHGTIYLPHKRLLKLIKNIPSKINDIGNYFWMKKNINYIDAITYQNNTNANALMRLYSNRLMKITMGCNFSYWLPGDRISARKQLKLPDNKMIFFTASNLIPLKQIDKMIFTFNELSEKNDFLLIIAGHGEKDYEDYLNKISSHLIEKGKIKFISYLRDDALRSYYYACDYYISTSISEGGPVSIMQALACNVPVVSTKTGNVAELMEYHNAGCLLNINDYKKWRAKLEKVMKGGKIKLLDREIAKKYYDWQNIAKVFDSLYREMASKYHLL